MYTFYSQPIERQIRNPKDLFESIASRTWKNMKDGFRLGLPLNEEGITDHILVEVAKHKFRILDFRIEHIKKATKSVEAQCGLDWEWWIGSQKGWIRYGVQAKRIDEKGNYKNLKHIVNGRCQTKLLDEFCRINKAVPLYCFYNYFELSQIERYWHCCKKEKHKSQLGCTITPSFVVHEAIKRRGARKFSHLHSDPHTVPWRCLVGCPEIKKLYSNLNPDDSDSDAPMTIGKRKFGQEIVLHPELPEFLTLEKSQWINTDTIVNYYNGGIFPKRVMVIEIPPETDPDRKPFLPVDYTSMHPIPEQHEFDEILIESIENCTNCMRLPQDNALNSYVNKGLVAE